MNADLTSEWINEWTHKPIINYYINLLFLLFIVVLVFY
jgi:hypothetical protein